MSDTKTLEKSFDLVGQIMAYEQGDLDQDDAVALFQHMIDDGTVWHLQGSYGRTAQRLIASGLCHRKA